MQGWQALQISTFKTSVVLRVMNELPQPQVTLVSTYLGWMLSFMIFNGTVNVANIQF